MNVKGLFIAVGITAVLTLSGCSGPEPVAPQPVAVEKTARPTPTPMPTPTSTPTPSITSTPSSAPSKQATKQATVKRMTAKPAATKKATIAKTTRAKTSGELQREWGIEQGYIDPVTGDYIGDH